MNSSFCKHQDCVYGAVVCYVLRSLWQRWQEFMQRVIGIDDDDTKQLISCQAQMLAAWLEQNDCDHFGWWVPSVADDRQHWWLNRTHQAVTGGVRQLGNDDWPIDTQWGIILLIHAVYIQTCRPKSILVLCCILLVCVILDFLFLRVIQRTPEKEIWRKKWKQQVSGTAGGRLRWKHKSELDGDK